MAKRTIPDANQDVIAQAINHSPGCTFIDTHNIPRNLPELKGFPDGLIATEGALTVLCEDTRAVRAVLDALPGVRILDGAIIPVEIKTEKGALRDSQTLWAQETGVASVVMRTIEQVFALLRF